MRAPLWLGLVLLVGACVPRWWEATPFEGDDSIAGGTLCESRDISALGEPFWVRVGIRWHDGVDVDWGGLELETTHAEILDKSLSEPQNSGSAAQLRYVVWTVKAVPESGEGGDTVTLGPVTVPWRPSRDGAFQDFTIQGCTATVR